MSFCKWPTTFMVSCLSVVALSWVGTLPPGDSRYESGLFESSICICPCSRFPQHRRLEDKLQRPLENPCSVTGRGCGDLSEAGRHQRRACRVHKVRMVQCI